MSGGHDPFCHANYIRECLSEGKRALGFLLGAGCPMAIKDAEGDPLIPGIGGITEEVRTHLASQPQTGPSFEKVVNHLQTDGLANPSVETILSYVRALRQVVGTDTVRELDADGLESLEKGICECIVRRVDRDLPEVDTPYRRLATWIGSVARSDPVEVFTTNYDILAEQALETCRVPYFDGFVGTDTPFFDTVAMEDDTLPARWARLWKLHGSINWHLSDRGWISRGLADAKRQNYLIHPSHLKYDESRRMPYLAMMDRLRSFLRKPSSVLVICGYSFGDQHLNEVLLQSLMGNASAIVFALLNGRLSLYENAVRLGQSRVNLSVLALDEAVIGTRRAPWAAPHSASEDMQSELVNRVTFATDDGQVSRRTEFVGGDFERFGEFLAGLVGVGLGGGAKGSE